MATYMSFQSLTFITWQSSMVSKLRRIAEKSVVISCLLGLLLVSMSPPIVCSCGSWMPHPHSPFTVHPHSHADVQGAAKSEVFSQAWSAIPEVHTATGDGTTAHGHALLAPFVQFVSLPGGVSCAIETAQLPVALSHKPEPPPPRVRRCRQVSESYL
jgi:hypothetical protein